MKDWDHSVQQIEDQNKGVFGQEVTQKPIYHLITGTNQKLNILKTKLNYWNKQRTIIEKKQKK